MSILTLIILLLNLMSIKNKKIKIIIYININNYFSYIILEEYLLKFLLVEDLQLSIPLHPKNE